MGVFDACIGATCALSPTFGTIARMKVELRASRIHGTGVFAIHLRSRGEILLAIDDTRIVDERHPIRAEAGELGDHCDCLPDGTTVLMQEPERYINHSCDPNAFVYSIERRRFVLALHDIDAGEEILYDYALNALANEEMECRCGASNCRGRHTPVFFTLPEKRQLELLPFLDPSFVRVHELRISDLLKRNSPNQQVHRPASRRP
jgi:hypothetical protein